MTPVIPAARGGARKAKYVFTLWGETYTVSQVAKVLNISRALLNGVIRRNKDKTLDEVLEIVIKRDTHNRLRKKYPCEYQTYYSMLARAKDKDNSHYGGRGIKVCDRWLGDDGFVNFMHDMGPRPVVIIKNKSVFSIDRIDVNKDYSPENCRWADNATQSRNRTDNRYVMYKGERMCISDACKKAGLKRTTVLERIKKGASVNEALTTLLGEWTCPQTK